MPAGKLRVGVNLGNFLLVNKDAATGELCGVVPDLAQELGRRLGASVELIPFSGAGQVADGAKKGAWDVAFIGAELQAPPLAFQKAVQPLTPSGSWAVTDTVTGVLGSGTTGECRKPLKVGPMFGS